ncbi:TetR/AcrR family transcriptional regulator [Bailinhaonella thermotolerans]|uniref:TetR/AcrR family transcriptional regulator n=1 Tax=Bailinhaonella thermotolerans TaxID=1070861 RepID=A0A3A4AW93_9ACTN|nr:TetR family transcriptional regulator [Bailinhaonella thermotolerans]RJL31594.1 TetR/AcrR family transcriptional regulator [Bailinhaonella thermotolerans]
MPKDTTATRDALLCAARAEFAEHGIAGARVDRIAQRAGVNKERIYGHFGNKEKLFDAVMRDALDEVAESVALPGDDPVDYVGRIYDFHRDNPTVVRLLMWEALHYRQEALPGEAQRVAQSARKVESLARGLGRDPSPDVARLVLTLIGLAVWPNAMPTVARLIVGPEADTPEGKDRMRDHVVEFARAALS